MPILPFFVTSIINLFVYSYYIVFFIDDVLIELVHEETQSVRWEHS